MTDEPSPSPGARPAGDLLLDAPPSMPPTEPGSGVAMAVVPVLGGLGSVVLLVSMNGTSGSSGTSSALRLGAVGLVLLATVALVLVQVDRQRQQRRTTLERARRDYLARLATARGRLREAQRHRHQALRRLHPRPTAVSCLRLSTDAADAAYLGAGMLVRWGEGDLAASPRPVAPEVPEDADPVCVDALERLVAAHRSGPGLPALLDLVAVARVEVCDEPEESRAHARALVCSAAGAHAPSDLSVAVLTDDLGAWDWLKWLPHARPAESAGTAVGTVLVTDHAGSLGPPLERRSARRALLVVDGPAPPPPAPATTVVELLGPGSAPAPGSAGGVHRSEVTPTDARPRVRPDRLSAIEAEAVARRIAGRQDPGSGRPGRSGLTALRAELGLGDVRRLDPAHLREGRTARDRLRVPIGVDDHGGAVHLDLKESAEQGAGPHGLVVGATGSGKSELVRTLVLGLAVTHSADELNLVLADFKGGATFAGLAGLPHVAALITNLSDDLVLVDRMHDALGGELLRRQELLRASGHASVRDHERARRAGADLRPLPSLLVVVDEFSEMLAARPELLDLFLAVGRLGRSLGLHLLLASQRLEEGRLRGLDAHLSYRVGLRTFSAQESRSVLGVPDAASLPPVPGLGYLRTEPTSLVRFSAAYVSGPAPAPLPEASPVAGDTPSSAVVPFRAGPITPRRPAAEPPGPPGRPGSPPSELEVAVAAVAAATGGQERAHQVWLPPLEGPEPLSGLLGVLRTDPGRGLHSPSWHDPRRLRVPVGWVDRPRDQCRDPLVLDLDGSGGHVGVVGGPRSGKSTFLLTAVIALALTATPRRCQVFALDLAGGALARLDGLPHLCARAERSEPDRVTRVVAEVHGLLERREAGRPGPGGGYGDEDEYGEVFLVVDGWAGLREGFPDLEEPLQQVAARGLGVGVHLVLSASRWSEVRAPVRDQLGSRVELRLGDPMDSELDRRAAAAVPRDRPGRALVAGGAHALVALPRLEGARPGEDADVGVHGLVERVRRSWSGAPAPLLRALPLEVGVEEVLRAQDPLATGRRLLLGLEERGLTPVWIDAGESHLLVLGDARSGRTTTLRTLVGEVVRTCRPDEAQLLVLDPRRTLLGEVPSEHLLAHHATAEEAAGTVADLATYLRGRLPGPTVSASQLRTRSWWSGAEVFVVIDDHDLLGGPHGTVLADLVPLLPRAADVGLHLWVARRTGGTARAWHDPVLSALRDLSAPGLLLSGNPEEGPLVGGVRARTAPPGRGRLVTRVGDPRVVQVAARPPVS